uniref:G_PROTEIN_RECEP_F1_2 domain-containing protein n=1 Tax=Brugia timori TaxID=42155 RepID=A0A0R3QTG6_9BILA
LVAAYIICWLPYNGLSLYHFMDPQGFFEAHANKASFFFRIFWTKTQSKNLYENMLIKMIFQVYCLHSIMVFNAVINPYLYGPFGNFLSPRRTDTN